jgi:hypothetical protein
MNPCFLCNHPTPRLRSVSQLTAHPTGPRDAIAICEHCDADWSFSLVAIARSQLAGTTTPSPAKSDPRNIPHNP